MHRARRCRVRGHGGRAGQGRADRWELAAAGCCPPGAWARRARAQELRAASRPWDGKTWRCTRGTGVGVGRQIGPLHQAGGTSELRLSPWQPRLRGGQLVPLQPRFRAPGAAGELSPGRATGKAEDPSPRLSRVPVVRRHCWSEFRWPVLLLWDLDLGRSLELGPRRELSTTGYGNTWTR